LGPVVGLRVGVGDGGGGIAGFAPEVNGKCLRASKSELLKKEKVEGVVWELYRKMVFVVKDYPKISKTLQYLPKQKIVVH